MTLRELRPGPPGPSRLKNGVPAPLRGGESGERRAAVAERPSDWEMDGDEEFLVARVPCNDSFR